MWTTYVKAVTRGTIDNPDADPASDTQDQIAARLGYLVHQTTIGHWLRGKKPTDGAIVAHFARSYDRNPLEAFVAADLITMAEAGRAIGTKERAALARLGITGPPVVDPPTVTRPAQRRRRASDRR